MFFDGQNSRLFQIASHVSQTLREALLFHEIRNKLGAQVGVRIGEPLPWLELARLGDRHQLIDHLRHLTYRLGERRRPPPSPRLRRRRERVTRSAGGRAWPG